MRLRSRKLPRDAVHHPVFARFYARVSVTADLKGGIAAYREELLSGLSGRVIEIGAGNGLNFAHYPGAVSEVVALEPERSLRQLAVRSALRAEVPVDVVPGAAEALPVKSEAFDGAVASLVLCAPYGICPGRSPRSGGSCGPAANCGSSNTGRRRAGRWPRRSGWPTGPCGRCSSAAVTRPGTRWPRSLRRASRWARTAGCGSRRQASKCPPPPASWAWRASRSPRAEG